MSAHGYELKHLLLDAELVAVLLEPGPGDALRFAHCLATKVHRYAVQRSVIILGWSAYQSCSSLLSTMKLIPVLPEQGLAPLGGTLADVPTGTTVIVLPNISDENFLADFFLEIELERSIVIYHCYEPRFIDEITGEFRIGAGKDSTCIKWKFIDRDSELENLSGAISSYLPMSLPEKKPQIPCVLLFLRFETIAPERNTPVQLFEEIVPALVRRGLGARFAGSVPRRGMFSSELQGLIMSRHLFPDGKYPPYAAQMALFRQAADVVLGVNSGALDLALAGGLPGIRIGAFHHLLPKHGPDFNRFLASSTVINIPALAEYDISNITSELCLQALELISCAPAILPPMHLWLKHDPFGPVTLHDQAPPA